MLLDEKTQYCRDVHAPSSQSLLCNPNQETHRTQPGSAPRHNFLKTSPKTSPQHGEVTLLTVGLPCFQCALLSQPLSVHIGSLNFLPPLDYEPSRSN